MVLTDLLAHKVLKVHLVLRDLLVLKVVQVLRDQQALLDLKALDSSFAAVSTRLLKYRSGAKPDALWQLMQLNEFIRVVDDQLLRAVAERPRLMQRPIVIDGDRALIARPPALLDDWLK